MIKIYPLNCHSSHINVVGQAVGSHCYLWLNKGKKGLHMYFMWL